MKRSGACMIAATLSLLLLPADAEAGPGTPPIECSYYSKGSNCGGVLEGYAAGQSKVRKDLRPGSSGSDERAKKTRNAAGSEPVEEYFGLPSAGFEMVAICPHPTNPRVEIECREFPSSDVKPVRIEARPAGQAAVPPRPLSIEEFKDFPVAKGELLIQPDQGRHTVNMPVVVATTARQHVVSGDLLGFAFHVRFTPVSHAFDYGDGSAPYVTGDPNTPYPNQRFWHEWWTIGDKTISVTTTWSGAYQVAGSAWVEVPGTLETTVSSEPQRVDEYHILLTDPDKATGGKHHDSDYDWLKGTPLAPNNQP